MAITSGFFSWEDIAAYAKGKQEFIKALLNIKGTMPSVSTFKRVISMIKPDKLEDIYRKWVLPAINKEQINHYSVDGKACRGAGKYEGCSLHTISIYVNGSGISIGQQAVSEKSNEITAIPILLNDIDITGGIVSIDAMGCQEKIADTIRNNGADYILSLRKNHKNAYEAVEEYFQWAQEDIAEKRELEYGHVHEISHGRVVNWKIVVTKCVKDFEFTSKWKDIQSIVMIERKCKYKGKMTIERRYFISSLKVDATKFGKLIRDHWGIENTLHWTLDVAFNEDASRIHERNAAKNMAALRKIALGLMIKLKTPGESFHKMQVRALFNDEYILSILSYDSK
jgi:predicted transposase YbfD/YdcC